MACSDGESIDTQTYRDLHTVIDLDGLYDLLEMREVHGSWVHAHFLNAQEDAARKAPTGGRR